MPKKKRKITIQSGKAKGRKLQQWVCQKLSDISGIPWGPDELIRSREMGQAGTDVVLIGEALEIFPWSIETKWQESWSIPSWIIQTKNNKKEEVDWLLFCKKNHHEEIVIMDAQYFLDLYYELLDLKRDREIKGGLK